MNATGSLVAPPVNESEDQRDARQKALWAATHERIERFLPGFLTEVLPPPPPAPAPVPPAVPVAADAAPAARS